MGIVNAKRQELAGLHVYVLILMKKVILLSSITILLPKFTNDVLTTIVILTTNFNLSKTFTKCLLFQLQAEPRGAAAHFRPRS